MARVEVITGAECRHRWSEKQKRAIVAQPLKPGAVVAEVARRAEVGPGQIYRWRQQLRTCGTGFAQVVIASAETADPPLMYGSAWNKGSSPFSVQAGRRQSLSGFGAL